MRHGTPFFNNWAKYAAAKDANSVADFVAHAEPRADDLEACRALPQLWKGNFVLKGIMHPDDAMRAHSLGVDGIMVSNHGARQLDNAPSPLQVLPAIRDAVGDKMTVMLDGGIRRGLDAVIALCTGAKFVFQWPADALRRDGGRHAGREEGARHLPPRDRPQHGADGRPRDRRSRPAVPDVEGRGGPAPQPALIAGTGGTDEDCRPRGIVRKANGEVRIALAPFPRMAKCP